MHGLAEANLLQSCLWATSAAVVIGDDDGGECKFWRLSAFAAKLGSRDELRDRMADEAYDDDELNITDSESERCHMSR